MLDLVMILHCHQPVGNFDSVFRLALDKCYRPILDLLVDHPHFRVGLHFSGPLLEWLEKHQPQTIDILALLVGRGQVEPLSGGFYEPLLASIPVRDARGQLEMMNDYLETRLGRRPTGFWLTERIWDPALPSALCTTGLEYTVVDDTHLYYAGLEQKDIFGPYLTEREGHTLKILATPMVMRYIIPFHQVDEVIGQFRTWNEEGRQVAVYGDDGEKFGLWPGTHEWVLEKGWLNRFFTAVHENREWLRTITPGEYLAKTKPLGRLYMPQASYEEMTEWALPPKRSRALVDMVEQLKRENRWEYWRPFVRGGVWDNFLVKYEESNRMHKKMLYLSQTADQILASPGNEASAALARQALNSVWRAQCNCAYWHGVFGGLYMGHLRRAIHENLIAAQRDLVAIHRNRLSLDQLDYDRDGFEEIIIQGPALSLGLAPALGGGLFDLCHMAKGLNLADVLTRRLEAYHHKLAEAVVDHGSDQGATSIHNSLKAKEPDLDRFLVYDDYAKISLLDHFLETGIQPTDLAAGKLVELGDFVQGEYRVVEARADHDQALVELVRKGRVGPNRIEVRKKLCLGKTHSLEVEYEFQAGHDEHLATVYACEFNLNLFSDEDGTRYLYVPEHDRRRELHEIGGEYHLTRFDLVNGGDGLLVSFNFSRQVSVLFFPLMTVSMSEDGFEKSYQGTSLFFLCPLDLEAGAREKLRLKLELTGI